MEKRILFHEQLGYERERRGWSQADVADKVGCDTKTVGRWESGQTLPRPYHRQKLCEIFGKSAEELGLVRKHTSYGNTPTTPSPGMNQDTSSSLPPCNDPLLPASTTDLANHSANAEESTGASTSSVRLRQDWGEAPQTTSLYGRDEECRKLAQWIGDHGCRVVVVLGMGGVGKTLLLATVAAQIKESFDYIFWRSLQNAPSLTFVLKQCLRFLSDQQPLDLPEDVDAQISLLIEYLRSHRCLLVLDNAESILQAGQHAGHYREGYEAYGKLIKRLGETEHQSCLLLTSREKPKEVAHLEGKTSPLRSLDLAGIAQKAGREMLKDKELFGSDEHWANLIDRYSGNPLALQLASESIREVFGGDIAQFLHEEAIAFGDINDLLDQQFHRLTDEEQEIMYWLAIEREPVPLEEIHEDLVHPVSGGTLLATLNSLRRRSLIETRGSTYFTLQAVIMEYVLTELIKRAGQEFHEGAGAWRSHALVKARSKDYIRESQMRLILAPVAQHLLSARGNKGIEQAVRSTLSIQRQLAAQQSGYIAGNVLNLLNYLHYDLRGFDFSSLMVRQAYLQNVSLPEVNFAQAHFISSIFTSTFGNVLSVACSPLGDLLAAGTTTGEIWIYHMSRATHLLTCLGHTDGVWCLAFSPDGRTLASSSDDHTIRVWDIETGRCLHKLQDHMNRVRAIAFSPDGELLASGSDDQTIRLWNVSTGYCLKTLQGHTSRVWSVAFAPDGKLLASGSTDESIRLWDINTGSCLNVLQGHSNWVRSVAFRPDGSMLASGSDDQTVRLWEVGTGLCLNVLQGHSSRVWSVAFSPEGQMVASGSEDQTIRLWDSATAGCFKILQGHTHGVRAIAFHSHEDILVSGGDDQTCRLWHIRTGDCLRTLQGYTNRVWSIAFSPDGSLLVSGNEDGKIYLWDVNDAHRFKTLHTINHRVLVVAFSSDGHTIASGGQDQTIRLWDVRTGRCLTILQGHTNWVRAVAFSPDSRLLASGGEDQTIRLWSLDTAQCLRILQDHSSWVRTLAFSPDGDVLASGSDDQSIRLWNVKTGQCLKTLQGHTNRVRSIAFSPAGDILVSGSEDQTVRLWDVKTGQCLKILQGHSSWVRSVAFNPRGNMFASGGEDQQINLWDVRTGECLKTLQDHMSRVRSVAFSPDGNLLASSSDDGMIKLWNIRTAECFRTFISERPYERMNITGVQGLTEGQKASLRALGAVEES